MASKIINSLPVTFLDLTDQRQIKISISSNLPLMQIYNPNSRTYTPDWTNTSLRLVPTIYVNSKNITNDSQTSIIWYKKSDNSPETQISTEEVLQISENVLSINPGIITYTCEATYQGIVARENITFARIEMGTNGEDGIDGVGVSIIGSADSVSRVGTTDYYLVNYNSVTINTASQGDSYLYRGHLYVYAANQNDLSCFVDVGQIKGDKGDTGADAKNISFVGDSQIFKVNKKSKTTPNTIAVTAMAVNTEITSWTYSINGGKSFTTAIPIGVIRNSNVLTITGDMLNTDSLVIKASDGVYSSTYSVYKTYDGEDGVMGQAAPIVFLNNNNITLSADSNGEIIGRSTSFSVSIIAYNGATKITPVVGTISGLPDGVTVDTSTIINNEVTAIFSFPLKSTFGSKRSNGGVITIPIVNPVVTNLKLNWSKVNTGETGKGIQSIVNCYLATNMSSDVLRSMVGWTIKPQLISSDSRYLWNYQTINYTDGSYEYTEPVIIGMYGEQEPQGVDWIVDQRISDIWTWKKWNSGIVECWGTVNIAGSNIFTESQIDLPFAFFNNTYVITVTPLACGATIERYVIGTSAGEDGRTASSFKISHQTTLESCSVSYMINIRGQWK